MYRRASHAILMHRRGFSTFRRGCVASQRVARAIPGHEVDSGFPFYISLKVTADFIRTIYTVYTLF